MRPSAATRCGRFERNLRRCKRKQVGRWQRPLGAGCPRQQPAGWLVLFAAVHGVSVAVCTRPNALAGLHEIAQQGAQGRFDGVGEPFVARGRGV
jgi:hypothetical protein